MNLVTNDDIEVKNAKAFAGIQDVVIGGFKVGFNESKTVTGSSRLVGGRTTGEMKLEGIDGATLQRITDQAYEDFVNRLEASGYRILPRETFTSHPLYAKLSEHDFPFRDDNSSLFSSYGVGNYYIPTTMGSKQVFFPDEVPQSKSSDLSAMFKSTPGQGLSAIGLTGTLQEFSEKTKVPLINVTYLVDFAAGSSAGFSMQQLKLGQLMSVDYGVLGLTTGYGGTFSSNNGKLALGQPVPSDKPFATMEDETSTGSQVAEGAFNLLFKGGILGAAGVGGDHTRTYVFRTEPEKFAAAALDVLDKTNELMVSKLAQLH
ncbi:hypothetical protein [Castellaniella sp.]